MPIKSSTSNKVYRYVQKEIVSIETNIVFDEFKNDWLEIKGNTISLLASKNNKYAWDGCTPKWEVSDFIVGVPDGKFDKDTEEAITYYASMIHDVLCQFGMCEGFPVSRKEADMIFKQILQRAKFRPYFFYYYSIRAFVIFSGVWKKYNTKTTRKDLKVTDYSWYKC